MTEWLSLLLQIAGAGLIALAVSHVPIGRQLNWRGDSARLTPVNAAVFRVHILFICIVLVMMGLPCLLDPQVFIEPSRAACWLTWSYTGFWGVRLYVQWFVYEDTLWRGKRRETAIHWLFTFTWAGLTALFAWCGVRQMAWLE